MNVGLCRGIVVLSCRAGLHRRYPSCHRHGREWDMILETIVHTRCWGDAKLKALSARSESRTGSLVHMHGRVSLRSTNGFRDPKDVVVCISGSAMIAGKARVAIADASSEDGIRVGSKRSMDDLGMGTQYFLQLVKTLLKLATVSRPQPRLFAFFVFACSAVAGAPAARRLAAITFDLC